MHCSLKRNSKRLFNNILIEIIHIHAVKLLLLSHPDFRYTENLFLKILYTKEMTKINKRKNVSLFEIESGIEIKSRTMVTLPNS